MLGHFSAFGGAAHLRMGSDGLRYFAEKRTIGLVSDCLGILTAHEDHGGKNVDQKAGLKPH